MYESYTTASLIDRYPYQSGLTPLLIIIRNAMMLRYPDMMKQILLRKFNIFYDREVRSYEIQIPYHRTCF